MEDRSAGAAPNRWTAVMAALLALTCFAAFAPAWNAGITNWDDEAYLDNPAAKAISSLAFQASVMAHYHPLTVLSFAIEQQLFGRNARELHMTNVALHAMTAALVVWLLALLSSSNTVGAVGGFFFAIHPLRVESVLWIAERKDVLCLLFFSATLLAYVYATRGSRVARVFFPVLFVLALLAKAVAITLPFLMMAIDYLEGRLDRRAVMRKLPYIAISVVFVVLNVRAAFGPVRSGLGGLQFSFIERLVLAASTVMFYLGKLLLPLSLSAYYQYPPRITAADIASVLALIAVIGIAYLSTRITRVIAFATAFFIIAVGPMLPLVSSGPTIAADRVPYAGSIGIALAVGVAAQWALRRSRAALVVLIAAGALLFAGTFIRSRVWHDSITLWSSVIDADPSVATAWNNRGAARAAENRRATIEGDSAALADIDTAIRLRPCYRNALHNRRGILLRHGMTDEAERTRRQWVDCRGRDQL